MSQQKQPKDITSRMYFGLVIIFLLLIAMPMVFLGLIYSNLTRRLKIKYVYHIGVVLIMLVLGYLIRDDIKIYFDSFKTIIKTQAFNNIDWTPVIKASIVGGLILGGSFEVWYEFRPDWVKAKDPKKEVTFQGARYEKTIEKTNNTEHPENGTIIGIDDNFKPIVITDQELNGGGLILGATGAGKTTTINNIIESCCQRKIPAVFVDGKGDKKQAAALKKIADKYGRKFYYFSMTGKSHNYNPLKHGDPTELKDKLISTSEWTEEHYKSISERYLQTAFHIFKEVGHQVDIVNVVDWLTPNSLADLISNLPEEKQLRYVDVIESNKKDIWGLINRLALFAESDIGAKLTDKSNVVIDLYQAIQEGAIVVFSLESLRFPEFARALGKMIVVDLKTVGARLLMEDKIVYTILDEFNVFVGPQVTDLINKTRGAGFRNVISTQELADMRVGGNAELMDQIIGNTNVKIIQRQDVPDSAEYLSALIGTEDSFATTIQVDGIRETGAGTVKRDKSFIIHPDKIKRLGTGRAIIVTKTPNFQVHNVKVRAVDIA